jgi:hypothetical protein
MKSPKKPIPSHHLELTVGAVGQVRPAVMCLAHTVLFQRLFPLAENWQDISFPEGTASSKTPSLGWGLTYPRAKLPSDVHEQLEEAVRQTVRCLDLCDGPDDAKRREATVNIVFGRHSTSAKTTGAKGGSHRPTDSFDAWEHWDLVVRLRPPQTNHPPPLHSPTSILEEQLRALMLLVVRECCRMPESVPVLSCDAGSFQVRVQGPLPPDGPVTLAGMLKRMLLETSANFFPSH